MFVDGEEHRHISLIGNAFPYAFDMAPDEIFEKNFRQLLSEKGENATSFFTTFPLLFKFTRDGDIEQVDRYLLHDGTWSRMLREGATITMEAWGDKFKANQDWNHAWGAAPANIIPRMFCGIRPVEPGFKRFIVDPQPGNVESFSFRMPTVKGEVKLEWSKDKKQLTVPENTEALYQGKILGAGTHTLN